MTVAEQPARADLLLARRGGRIADELERSAADGWLVYDFRGSNPAFGRLLGSGLQREGGTDQRQVTPNRPAAPSCTSSPTPSRAC